MNPTPDTPIGSILNVIDSSGAGLAAQDELVTLIRIDKNRSSKSDRDLYLYAVKKSNDKEYRMYGFRFEVYEPEVEGDLLNIVTQMKGGV